jgi:hypothetical protein
MRVELLATGRAPDKALSRVVREEATGDEAAVISIAMVLYCIYRLGDSKSN